MSDAPKKQKLPIYVDAEGRRRDPNRTGHPVLCNAKSKRTGELCMNIAMKNGKCRIHGGKATGPKTLEGRKRISMANRKHKFKTGEKVPIWFDTLTPEEKAMLIEKRIPNDAPQLLEEEIIFTTIRERRMMQLIEELRQQEADVLVQEHYKRRLVRDANGDPVIEDRPDGMGTQRKTEMVLESMTVSKSDIKARIQAVEEALTRVQNHKAKLIELKHKMSEGKLEEDDNALNQLVSIISKAREIRIQRTAND
jgi:hypothetical protein